MVLVPNLTHILIHKLLQETHRCFPTLCSIKKKKYIMIIRKIQVISIYIFISFANCNHPSLLSSSHSLEMLQKCYIYVIQMNRRTFNYFLTHHRDLSFHSFILQRTHILSDRNWKSPLGAYS